MNTPFPVLPLVSAMLTAARQSTQDLRTRVSEVRPLPYGGTGPETFAFQFDGKPYRSALTGRNRNLCLGFGAEQDAGIAVRALLDGDVREVAAS